MCSKTLVTISGQWRRCFFFNLEILPLPSQNTPFHLFFMAENTNQLMISSEIYDIDTMEHAKFHQQSVY
jgi:hypothetical protein